MHTSCTQGTAQTHVGTNMCGSHGGLLRPAAQHNSCPALVHSPQKAQGPLCSQLYAGSRHRALPVAELALVAPATLH